MPFFWFGPGTAVPAGTPGAGLPPGNATAEEKPISQPLKPSSNAFWSTLTQPSASGTMKWSGGLGPGGPTGGVGEVAPVPRIRTVWSVRGLPFHKVYRLPTSTSQTKPPVTGVGTGAPLGWYRNRYAI